MDISAYTHTRNPASIGFPAKDNISASNNSPVMGENLIIDQSQDAYSQASQVFRQLGHDVVETSFREDAVSSDFEKVKAQYRGMMMASKNTADQYQRVADGRGHIAGVSSLIDNIHSGYQKQYAEVVKVATAYMQDINTAIGGMSSHMKAGDGGKIKFYPEDFASALNKAVEKHTNDKYSGSNPSDYFKNWNPSLPDAKPIIQIPITDGAFEFWEKKLGGQGFVIKKTAKHINIHPDYKPIKEIYTVIANSSAQWSGSEISAQEFQSLQTAIDAQKNAVNSSVSRLLETFRQDNSHFETLVQLLIQLIKDLNQNNNSLINM
ncbi:TPA: IpaD/SipD/SspD family type III secretion system needle tip protein [Providencia alcalifaciens]